MPIASRAGAVLAGIFGGSGSHVVQIIILAVVAVVLIGYFVFRIGQGGGRVRAAAAPVSRHEPDATRVAASDEATLRLVRAWTGIIGAAHEQWNIAIDGIVVGSIAGNETVDVAVEPGHHTLRLEAGRHRSAVRTFDVKRAEVVGFRCHGPRIWPMLVVALINPNLWISLSLVERR
jgi:hypothetical protein